MSELIGIWDRLRSFFAAWGLSEGQYGLIGVALGFALSQGGGMGQAAKKTQCFLARNQRRAEILGRAG
jgi:hypothetical protein